MNADEVIKRWGAAKIDESDWQKVEVRFDAEPACRYSEDTYEYAYAEISIITEGSAHKTFDILEEDFGALVREMVAFGDSLAHASPQD